MAESPTTVTATGIAKIAGVGRAAVSNWRRRYTDFPEPVAGTSASPAFDLATVEQWLEGQGKLPEATPRDRTWRRIEAFSASSQLADALCLVGAVLLAGLNAVPSPRELGTALDSHGKATAALLRPILPPAWSPAQHKLLEAAAILSQEASPTDAFEYLHEQFTSARGSTGFDVTPHPLADLMVDLVSPASNIFDFSCSSGTLLRAAGRQALDDHRPIHIYGQTANPGQARIALLRLLLLQQWASVTSQAPDIRAGDPLLADEFPQLSADAVVANPPFGLQDWGHEQLAYDSRWTYGGLPPRTEPELAWVQHALAHLAPGGYAALLMPPAAASRATGRRIRSELVRRGALQAVFALPVGALPSTSIGFHIWLLRRPHRDDGPGERVLFIDTSTQIVPRSDNTHWTEIRQSMMPAWRAYLDDPQSVLAEPRSVRSVPVVELLDEDVDLTPLRHLPAANAERHDAEALLDLASTFNSKIEMLRGLLPPLAAAHDSVLPAAPIATLDGLARTGALALLRTTARGSNRHGSASEQRSRRSAVDVAAVVTHDVISGNAPSGTVQQDDSDETVIQAGDILIPAITRSVVARVATHEQVGARIGMGVHVVRVNPEILDPWFTAGVLSSSENTRKAGRSTAGTGGALRIDVKRLQLPVLPIDTQRRYGSALKSLASFETELARAAELGHETARSLAEGLINGTLEPDTLA
ncbi:N-6 DNA methylase [Streptomyces sp. SPB162]|uniref:N-6 DNA methylase n=1 Tax=Streptomyces sp. SPB162 TaxID=2940560 RepID=UPI00240552EE|nr:N-6 DNA methylase [Streptomyces sp. SPB162]MDF9816759.1 hypothetical protein [Streptomyces sp. SPB162]